MDPFFLVFTLVVLGFGVALLVGGLQKLLLWRLIHRTPTSPAGAVAMGPVEVSGTVEAEDPLEKGPFSLREAAYGRWMIEELRSSGKSQKWVKVDGGAVGGAFRVRDASGSVRVEPDGAQEDLETTWSQGSGLANDPPPHVIDFLRSRGKDFEGWFGINKRMRFRETMLFPGEEVYVLGVASMDDGMRTAIREGSLRFPFLVSSRPQEGTLRQARNAALGLLLGGALFLGAGVFMATRLPAT